MNGIFPCLPQHGKTLIRTKTEFTVTSFCPENSQDHSEFAYIGISTQLQRIINPANHPENKVLKLQFNVDGLPLFKSGGIEFWPILGKVHFMSDLYDPFIIAVYKGIGKPSLLNRYFKEFVKELNHLLQNGIVIDKEFFTIEIMCFVCDTPARVFVKNTCGHTGYFACGRCSQKGQNIENRTIFSSVSAPKRTDETFRQQDQPEHHNGFSPLLNIKPTIDMIYHFSLDFMHMCCLGVMKKLLEYWLTSTQDIRLNRENIMRFTQRITNLSKQISTEFQRQILQSLGLISVWEATGLRFFLLYCGPFIVKDLLSKGTYDRILNFHVAMRILCNEKLCQKFTQQAENCLIRFVLLCGKLYTSQSLILNVHSLIHLVDDVKFFGCSLSETTAFPFENLLGKIKKLIHSGRKPLQQLCRRLSEQYSIKKEKITIPPIFEIIKCKQFMLSNNFFQIQKFYFYL